MAKDKKYNVLKTYLEAGKASSLNDVFDIVPMTVIRKDLGISYKSMIARMEIKAISIWTSCFGLHLHLQITHSTHFWQPAPLLTHILWYLFWKLKPF
jgi:hypothetical protein